MKDSLGKEGALKMRKMRMRMKRSGRWALVTLTSTWTSSSVIEEEAEPSFLNLHSLKMLKKMKMKKKHWEETLPQ